MYTENLNHFRDSEIFAWLCVSNCCNRRQQWLVVRDCGLFWVSPKTTTRTMITKTATYDNVRSFLLSITTNIMDGQWSGLLLRTVAYRYPVSILYKSIAGRYRPVRVADGPRTARCRFIKNASWVAFISLYKVRCFILKYKTLHFVGRELSRFWTRFFFCTYFLYIYKDYVTWDLITAGI